MKNKKEILIIIILITLFSISYIRMEKNIDEANEKILNLEKDYKYHEINLSNLEKNAKVQFCPEYQKIEED